LDLRSPDKQKYLTLGAVVGGVTYSLYYDYYKSNSYPINHSKVKQKAFLASMSTVLGFAVLKQVNDYRLANYKAGADDYSMDVATALLGCLSINLTIQLFH
jgi:hypothetical protein